jgi:MFS family permease
VYLTVLNLGMFVGYNVFGLIADRIGRRPAIILALLGVSVMLPLYASDMSPAARTCWPPGWWPPRSSPGPTTAASTCARRTSPSPEA